MKLKNILNESSYGRGPKIGEEQEEKGMTNEEKREFLKGVSEYKKFGESIYRAGDLAEVYESIKGIVETANTVTLEETGDWFDKVTVGRHMKSMNESFKVFSNTIKEVNTLQQRLESCYDEMGEVLGKYYEIKEGNEFGAERAKAIAGDKDEFEVDGKKYPVKGVDKEDKENAEEFTKESVVNENKYSIIDPKGNQKGIGTKDQANKLQKKLGGSKKGYFVVPAKSALKARRAMEKYQFDFKNPKLQDKMSGFYFDDEMYGESVNEASTETPEGKLLNKANSYKDFTKWISKYKKYIGKPYLKDILRDLKDLKYIEADYEEADDAGDSYNEKEELNYAIGELYTAISVSMGYNESVVNEVHTMKLKDILNESFGIGELPSSKLKTMKVSAKDMLDSVRTNEATLNESPSSEELRIVMMAVRKLAKYRQVPISSSINDLLNAAEQLQRDIKNGKIKK